MLVSAALEEWNPNIALMHGAMAMNMFTFRVLEGGLASATVLVSFGVLLGKLNPLQLLFMGLVETVMFVANSYIGYTLLGVIDGGENMDCTLGSFGKIHTRFFCRNGQYNLNVELGIWGLRFCCVIPKVTSRPISP